MERISSRYPKRRKFVIKSEFGGPRRWRGKKNRPCDVCRKRKTACIIETSPPCLHCKKMNLRCLSSLQPNDVPVVLSEQESPSSHHEPTAEGQSEGGNLFCLEGDPERNPVYMGPIAEQDPDILTSFKASLVSELDEVDAEMIQVCPGGPTLHDPPVHFNLVLKDFPDVDNDARKAASDEIESQVAPYGPSLVRLFFRHVHPTWPVLMKATFLRQYDSDRDDIPASLRGAVYALASAFWKRDSSIRVPCPFQQSVLETQCLDSLRREMVAPSVASLQGCLLLQLIRSPEVDSIESSAILALAAQATAAAHLMGLHKDPGDWRIPLWEKACRKRLWWATYVADAWAAQSFGTPYHIHADMYSTTPVEIGDMVLDEDVPAQLRHLVAAEDVSPKLDPAARFIATVGLAQILRQVLDVSLRRGMPMRPAPEQMQSQLEKSRQKLEEWRRMLPSCLSSIESSITETYGNNAPLLLAFHATEALLFRGLMAPATTTAKADTNSAVRKWIPTALKSSQSFTSFIASIGVNELDGFWGRYARSQLNICGNFLIYLFLLAYEPGVIDTAFALLGSFHESLQKLNEVTDDNSRLLIRPVALRIDSFFISASKMTQQISNKS